MFQILPRLLISLVFIPHNTHNSGQPSPLCPGLLGHVLFLDQITGSPSLLRPLSLFFPLGFNERPTSHGNPSSSVTAAAKVKPRAGIVHKYREGSEGKERTIRAIYLSLHSRLEQNYPPRLLSQQRLTISQQDDWVSALDN